jgi:hypothetical protein
VLGSYSPSTGMALFNTRRRATPAARDTSHGYDCPRTARDGAHGGGHLGRAALSAMLHTVQIAKGDLVSRGTLVCHAAPGRGVMNPAALPTMYLV